MVLINGCPMGRLIGHRTPADQSWVSTCNRWPADRYSRWRVRSTLGHSRTQCLSHSSYQCSRLAGQRAQQPHQCATTASSCGASSSAVSGFGVRVRNNNTGYRFGNLAFARAHSNARRRLLPFVILLLLILCASTSLIL